MLGHKELPGSQIGVTTSGEEVRIFADLDETTWSLVIYSPNGIAACVVLVGIGPFPSPNLPGRKIRN